MQIHITKLLELVDKFKAIGENIKDDHIAALLLCSVPSSYDTLITALEARPEGELTPEFIKGKLIDEYNRRVETDSSESKALKASFRDKTKKEKFCTYCHRKNHFRSECFYLKSKNQRISNTRHYSQNKANLGLQSRQGNSCNLAEKVESPETSGADDVIALTCSHNKTNALEKFVIDSGAFNHMMNNKQYFTEFEPINPSGIMIANGAKLTTEGKGTVSFKVKNINRKTSDVILSEALYVPELETNLISVKKITEKGLSVLFNENKCVIAKEDKIILECNAINNLYQIQPIKPNENPSVYIAFQCRNKNCIQVWHR